MALNEYFKLFITLFGGFALGYLCRWLLDRRSERRGLIKQVVERYCGLPEPRDGASASLERLAMLQRCGAGLLTRSELSEAGASIQRFGRPDPLATRVSYSAFDLLQRASNRGHALGSALETYDWIVSIATTPKPS
jgi:hypothetical protein